MRPTLHSSARRPVSPAPGRPFQSRTKCTPAAAHALMVFILLALLAIPGCARRPDGPPFAAANPPLEPRARIYVYRADGRSSVSQVRVTLDGQEFGLFRDGEYATREVAAGTHRLRAGLRSVGFVAWGWNEQPVRLKPGETVYIELSVRLTEHAQPAGRALDIGGRPSASGSENVYLQRRGKTDALEALATTTQVSAAP